MESKKADLVVTLFIGCRLLTQGKQESPKYTCTFPPNEHLSLVLLLHASPVAAASSVQYIQRQTQYSTKHSPSVNIHVSSVFTYETPCLPLS